VTDNNWYRFLADRPGVTEVNFWQPSGAREFRVRAPGEPFWMQTTEASLIAVERCSMDRM